MNKNEQTAGKIAFMVDDCHVCKPTLTKGKVQSILNAHTAELLEGLNMFALRHHVQQRRAGADHSRLFINCVDDACIAANKLIKEYGNES